MSASTEPLATVDQLIKIAQHPKMVGIGETGLDYHYTAESAEIQKTSLKIHIEAARETNLPLIIHSRAADEDMAAILKDEFNNGHYKCVMHCFSSSVELAKLSLDLGFYLSMSGIITFKKSEELRTIFKLAPIDQVLVETDSPYLSPVPFRGKRNEPSYTAHTAEMGASIYGLDYETFANQTTKNFNKLFSKAAI
jgi:TatD DNase family protein